MKEKYKDDCKNIPPKIHALVQHLLGQFKEYGGIGDFDEQFVERSHQSGKDDLFDQEQSDVGMPGTSVLRGGRRYGVIQK